MAESMERAAGDIRVRRLASDGSLHCLFSDLGFGVLPRDLQTGLCHIAATGASLSFITETRFSGHSSRRRLERTR